MEKTCKVCGIFKSPADFYNEPRNSDGKRATCKACENKRHAEYVATHIEELRTYRNNRKPQKAEAAKRYRIKHLAEVKQRAKDWHKRRRKENLERMRQWANEHKEHKSNSRKDWRKNNPEKVTATKLRRYAKLHSVPVSLTPEQITAIKSKGCFFCGSYENLTIAHDIPVAHKGHTTRGNTFCLCRTCNGKMQTKSLAEMIEQLSFS